MMPPPRQATLGPGEAYIAHICWLSYIFTIASACAREASTSCYEKQEGSKLISSHGRRGHDACSTGVDVAS